ncbi:MAG: aldehyde dehydrogenase EutE [Candidatus Eisenbacteria sp.]|nr:aldehyde dehydrogenase EutE [Candidatus Eisenbacteria bacterium]
MTDDQVRDIARRVVASLGGPGVSAPSPAPSAALSDRLTEGVFADIDSAVRAAAEAQRALVAMTLSDRNRIISGIRKMILEHAEPLAAETVAETGFGRPEDKTAKNRLAAEKTPGPEVLTPTARSGDHGLALFEAAPYGVIGSITPVTNATSTIICNTIGMVAAGNSVVFNVHPSARKVSIRTVALINQAIREAGGPPNVVTTLAEPTIESAQELMKHAGVRLLCITGGAGVVKAAMRSGKRAICAGPGNPPVVVDETADLDQAGRDIVRGASFDNNIVCVCEKEILAVSSIADALLASMKRQGAVVLTTVQLRQMERVLFPEREPGKIPAVEKSLIGRNVDVILSKIGVNVGPEIRLAVVETDADHPLVLSEQMTPILPLVRVRSADEGIDLALKVEHGFRHSAIMHSRNLDNLSRMARTMDCSIFVKNGPAVAGLGFGGEGHCSFSIASPTGEGVTGPRNFARERRCVLVDHFRIV